jgi:hypothetical protein
MSRVADQGSDVGRELQLLESELKRLEAEYNMFFAGRLKRPPLETRGRVEAFVKRLDRTPITNYAERFRFTTVQSRFSAFVELWDRGLRAREEGRPWPCGRSGLRARIRRKRSDAEKSEGGRSRSAPGASRRRAGRSDTRAW